MDIRATFLPVGEELIDNVSRRRSLHPQPGQQLRPQHGRGHAEHRGIQH